MTKFDRESLVYNFCLYSQGNSMKNILLTISVVLFFSACGEDKAPQDSHNKAEETKATLKEQNTTPKSTIVPELAKTGQTLFMACAGCHGANAQKSALNKSQVIQGWSKERIKSALVGYQEGTYGSTMKGLMKGQVASLSQEDIAMVSEYISKL